MDLVSIIVPVYQVELYLDKCIESIVNQTYKNLEIKDLKLIVVNASYSLSDNVQAANLGYFSYSFTLSEKNDANNFALRGFRITYLIADRSDSLKFLISGDNLPREAYYVDNSDFTYL